MLRMAFLKNSALMLAVTACIVLHCTDACGTIRWGYRVSDPVYTTGTSSGSTINTGTGTNTGGGTVTYNYGTGTGSYFAREADTYIGSNRYSDWKEVKGVKSGETKDYIYVAEVLEAAGAHVPMKKDDAWSPIDGDDWDKHDYDKLVQDPCWNRAYSPQIGDVAALDKHVGIVTGINPGQVTHVQDYDKCCKDNGAENLVVRDDWGFRSGQQTIFWRYTCQLNIGR